MPNLSQETGRFLTSQRRALAEAVVARQYALEPGLPERYGEGGRAKCVQDTEYHLAHLAAAVMFSSPALFSDYVSWAKTVVAAHGVGREDVGRNLDSLREVLDENLPGGMGECVTPVLESAAGNLAGSATAPPSFLDGGDALSGLARRYLDALLRAERHEAGRLILDATGAGVAVADIYSQVFQRCQWEVGRLWQLKLISVAQEHYCTAATQLVMSQLYPALLARPRNGRRLVAASVGGELHEIGLRVVADLFEADGWDTVYLGSNLPAESVVRSVERHRPDLLAVSVTMAFHLPLVVELISLVRSSEAGRAAKIMVGGHPFNVDAELWRRVGADGHAGDAGGGLEVAARLLNLPGPEGRKTSPAEALTGIGKARPAPPQPDAGVYDELSRLNNELLTSQRELARKNAHLERLTGQLAEADRRKDELLAALARDALLLANVRDSVIVTDMSGVVTYWNEGATRLFGWTAGEMVGRLYADRFPEPARQFIIGEMRGRAGGTDWEGEFEDYRKDGSRVWIDARVRQVRGDSGTPVGILGISHDITARKRLEGQARQAQTLNAVARLAGGVAHGFNNMMTTVLGHAELMLGVLRPDDPLAVSVQEIKRSAARTAALTQKLLAFSRKQMLTLRPADLNAVVRGLEATIRPMLGRIWLDLALAPGPLTTQTDRDQLEECILSLVRTACGAMPHGGRLTLRTASGELDERYAQARPEVRPGPYVSLTVADTGEGMTTEALGHLFEPFSDAGAGEVGGEVGPAAAYGFVKQCGGDIEVTSEAGKGTTFHLYLPLGGGPAGQEEQFTR